jgi:hypothetical protein
MFFRHLCIQRVKNVSAIDILLLDGEFGDSCSHQEPVGVCRRADIGCIRCHAGDLEQKRVNVLLGTQLLILSCQMIY